MENPENVRVKLEDITQEFIEEYHLLEKECHGWVYLEIFQGCYGFPQSGKVANNLLQMRLEDAHYYETAINPGLWRHKWRSIQFVLIVDDFGLEYVRKQDANHLASVLKNHHDISQDWEGKKFAGIDLGWNYATKHCDRTCRLSMKNYIRNLLVKLNHPIPSNPQLPPPQIPRSQAWHQDPTCPRRGHVQVSQ